MRYWNDNHIISVINFCEVIKLDIIRVIESHTKNNLTSNQIKNVYF